MPLMGYQGKSETAATGLIILLKYDSNRPFFSKCDLAIWLMTLKNNRARLLYYVKLCASFQIHRWVKTGVTIRKHSSLVKIGYFLSHVTLKFVGWPWKTIGNLFYTTSNILTSVHCCGRPVWWLVDFDRTDNQCYDIKKTSGQDLSNNGIRMQSKHKSSAWLVYLRPEDVKEAGPRFNIR